MVVTTRSGVVITVNGNFISCSNGKIYSLIGTMLSGSDGVISHNIKSKDEAVGIIIGMYGGKLM